MKCLVLFSLLLTLFSSGGHAQQNPFRRPAATQQDSMTTPKTTPSPKSTGSKLWKIIPFGRTLLSGQRILIGKLSSMLRSLKASPHPSTFAMLLLFAFLYGIIHSLGPGHAKTLFASHGLARGSPHRKTWIAGMLFSVTHTGSAILLFTVFRLLLGSSRSERDAFSHDMMVVSGILITVAGIIILFSSLLEKKAQSAAGTLLLRSTGLRTVAVIAGLAPCPGAFLILTFSHIVGILPVGIAAVVAVSLGMSITVSFAGMAGSGIGKRITTREHHQWLSISGTIIRYIAAVMIITVGLLMAFG